MISILSDKFNDTNNHKNRLISLFTNTIPVYLKKLPYFFKTHKINLLKQWIITPTSLIITLCLLYGVDEIILKYMKITFPPSVALMLVNFVLMCLITDLLPCIIRLCIGTSRATNILSFTETCVKKYYLPLIDYPLGWGLRWMTLFFTPAFVNLPLSKWISCREAFLIVAVFVFGLLLGFLIIGWTCVFTRKVVELLTRKGKNNTKQDNITCNEAEKEKSEFDPKKSNRTLSSGMKEQQEEDDEERRENESLISGLAEQNDGANSNNNLFEGLDMENSRLLETYEPAAIKRSNTWNSIYNTNSKNKYTHYYDENVDDDNISLVNLASHTNLDYDMASFPPTDINHVDKSIKGVDGEKAYVKYNSLSFANDNLKNASILDFIKRQQKKYYNPEIVCKRAEIQQEQYSTDSRTTNANTARNNNINNYYIDEDLAISEEREKNAKIMLFWESHFHHFVYFIAWFTIGIWTYYFTSYVMPFQLFTLICTFMLVTDFIPSTFKYKRILHPVLCSVALSLLVFLISALINNRGEISFFLKDLKHFQTGRNYLKLFKDKQKGIQYWPGAGDFFSSCMDVSITALSIPMYSYRKDLYYNAHVMLPPIFIFTIGNLFLYPLISHKIGISPENSIGYMGRSITLALGTPAITNFNGNVTVMAVTTVVTGVLGVLIGDRLMKICRIPVEDDPVIRGLTLGCNCTAIATAYLLGIDVRAAAISSLSFVVYGTIMVVLSCIAPVVKFVDVTLAGMA